MTKEYTKEQKLSIIQYVMSDKTVSFGCKCIIARNGKYKEHKIVGGEIGNYIYLDGNVSSIISTIYNILGHDVMIGDVLDWLENNNLDDMRRYCSNCNCFGKIETKRNTNHIWCSNCEIDNGVFFLEIDETILYLWKEKRKPIEYQSEECISFIYNLIKYEQTTK